MSTIQTGSTCRLLTFKSIHINILEYNTIYNTPRFCGFVRDEAKSEWNDIVPTEILRCLYFVSKIGQDSIRVSLLYNTAHECALVPLTSQMPYFLVAWKSTFHANNISSYQAILGRVLVMIE